MTQLAVLPAHLQTIQQEVERYASDLGLDFPEVRFIMLDFSQINQVAAYDGFPRRYPHWRFGMEYERLRKSYAWGLHRIYEMVINTDPCYAYLLASNLDVDQKLVMAHVYGHADFFKNNLWFAHTNRHMLDEMANHATRIGRYVDKFGLDIVENFIDRCLSLENLIDIHQPSIRRLPARAQEPHEASDETSSEAAANAGRLRSSGYMDQFINPPDYLEAIRQRAETERQREKNFPVKPQKDLLLFLLEHAPLEPWQQDIVAIVREEALYFAPQRQTKIMNEGWACAVGNTLVATDRGMLRLDEIVQNRLPVRVSDGRHWQKVYGWAQFENEPTIRMTTQRGFTLEGSVTHRVRLTDGRWRRLDQLQSGDVLDLIPGLASWPTALQPIEWRTQRQSMLENVTTPVGVSALSIIRHGQDAVQSRQARLPDGALAVYEREFHLFSFAHYKHNKRPVLSVPATMTPQFAAFLGYLVGNGQISLTKRELELTTDDLAQAERFGELGASLFGLTPSRQLNDHQWRIRFDSSALIDLLRSCGLTAGPSAKEKSIPALILRSPKAVVSAFLRAYFDCNAHAGQQGIVLSTASKNLSEQVQIFLLQFGILSRRCHQQADCWQLHLAGTSAEKFATEIGFGLQGKQAALRKYLTEHPRFKTESWTDEVVLLEPSVTTVYDISVEQTHCYAANGLLNHNSYWHSHIMTRHALSEDELIDYADHHSGTLATSPGRINPYKLGIELFRDIEDRWNRGAFGPEYEACINQAERANWDRQLGLGRAKIFEVRCIYNDIGFIDEFLTRDFAKQHQMFSYRYNRRNRRYEIESREFNDIKRQLLTSLTNFGEPNILVQDANFQNRGELYLGHCWEGVDLRLDYAQDTLENVHAIWQRPVHLETHITDRGAVRFSYNGTEHSQQLLAAQKE